MPATCVFRFTSPGPSSQMEKPQIGLESVIYIYIYIYIFLLDNGVVSCFLKSRPLTIVQDFDEREISHAIQVLKSVLRLKHRLFHYLPPLGINPHSMLYEFKLHIQVANLSQWILPLGLLNCCFLFALVAEHSLFSTRLGSGKIYRSPFCWMEGSQKIERHKSVSRVFCMTLAFLDFYVWIC